MVILLVKRSLMLISSPVVELKVYTVPSTRFRTLFEIVAPNQTPDGCKSQVYSLPVGAHLSSELSGIDTDSSEPSI